MRKRRGGLGKIGILSVALLMALGAMGTAYSYWTDTVNISTTVKTGKVDTRLTWARSEARPDTFGGYIWAAPSGMTIDVHAVNIQDVPNYYCYFKIINSTGSLPVKIQSITITPAVADWQLYPLSPIGPPHGFNGSVKFDGVIFPFDDASWNKTPDMVIGDQIDPGETKTGRIHVYLDGAAVGSNFDVRIEVKVVIWNQYVGP